MKTHHTYLAVFAFLTFGTIACGNGDLLDVTRPLIVTTEPVNGETGVPVNRAILIGFDEDLDTSTVSTTNFSLEDSDQNSIAGNIDVDFDNRVAVFTPTENLDILTVYTATITTGIEDDADNNLAADASWSFTTGALQDNSAPTVLATGPADGEINVSRNVNLSISFSEPMNPVTLTTATVTIIDQNNNLMSGTLRYNVGANTLSFDPDHTLDANTDFTVSITTEAEDLSGNNLFNDFVWDFTTGS